MRRFESFSATGAPCLLCGTNADSPCTPAGIDGTGDGRIEEFVCIHIDCIDLRFNREAGAFYQWIAETADRGEHR